MLRAAALHVRIAANRRLGRSGSLRTVCMSDRDDEIPKVDFKGFGKRQNQGAPLIKTLSSLSKAQGKDVDSTGRKLVMGDTSDASGAEDVWRQLDSKVNEYPFERPFKAIGSGGEEFATSMVTAVEGVLGRKIAAEKVTTRYSSGGKYITVVVSVVVTSGEEVVSIYDAMRADTRMRFFF